MINFENISVAVFGDIMLDKYIFGQVDRISPEAPIPIVQVTKETFVPGGAANVAANIESLGAKAFLFGITGNDTPSTILINESKKMGIDTNGIFIKPDVHTIQKIRIIGQSQQLLRLDYESKNYANEQSSDFFVNRLKSIENLSAIIISDYAKGTMSVKLMDYIDSFALSNRIPIFIDPKPSNAILYKNAFLITPNLKEAEGLCNFKLNSIESIEKCGNYLMNKYSSNIIITRGSDGMSVFNRNNEIIHIPTKARQVFDVSGAGDTVIAALCLSTIAGEDLISAANIANHAAGIKVGKLGTAVVTMAELINSMQ